MKEALVQCRWTAEPCYTCKRAIKEEDKSPLKDLCDTIDKQIVESMEQSMEIFGSKIVRVCKDIHPIPTANSPSGDDDYSLECRSLENNTWHIDTSRELVVPEDKRTLLRLLGQFAELQVFPCTLEKHWPSVSVIHQVRTILAKVDFTLLERGVDMVPLCQIVGLNYYNRDRDLYDCGESFNLIEYYLSQLPNGGLHDDRPGDGKEFPLDDKYLPLFEAAVNQGIIDSSYQIVTTIIDFVRLCKKMNFFYPYGRPAFRPIKNILKDKDGKPITESQLAQAYSDAMSKTKKGV